VLTEVRSGVIRVRREESKCSMWSMPLAEDQDAVGEFALDSESGSFGEAVRSRPMRRDLHGVDLSVRFTPDTTICTRTSPW
jgi:hypothetical protein